MNHRYLKNFVVSLIAIVLVYYSVAWAVLRCFHEEDFSNSDAAVSDASDHTDFSSYSLHRHQDEAHLDCMRFDHHTETLAWSSSASQLHMEFDPINSRVTAFLPSPGVGGPAKENCWLALLGTSRGFPYSTDSPLYLYHSVLRI